MSDRFLVIGATLQDTKGKPIAGLEPGTSNPAHIRHTRGGTARNVAENLGRLGADVVLISAVGDDHTGQQLLAQIATTGVNVEHVKVASGMSTGSYIALLDADGSLSVAMDDVRVMSQVTAGTLYRNRKLFRDARMVMIDGSLEPSTMEMAVRLADQYGIPLIADPSSTRLAPRLCEHLSSLHLVVPNEVEAAAMIEKDFTGYDPDLSLEIALQIRQAGVNMVVVTLSDFGLVYVTSDETGYIPATYSEVVDSTGTGDAVTASIMFGLANDLPAIEAIRLGAAAASLTLQTGETVVKDLSLDMLFDHLIV